MGSLRSIDSHSPTTENESEAHEDLRPPVRPDWLNCSRPPLISAAQSQEHRNDLPEVLEELPEIMTAGAGHGLAAWAFCQTQSLSPLSPSRLVSLSREFSITIFSFLYDSLCFCFLKM